MREEETGPLPIPLKFYDKRREKLGQKVFCGIPDLGSVENLCVAQGEGGVEDIAVRVGKDLKPPLPAVQSAGVRRLRSFEKL